MKGVSFPDKAQKRRQLSFTGIGVICLAIVSFAGQRTSYAYNDSPSAISLIALAGLAVWSLHTARALSIGHINLIGQVVGAHEVHFDIKAWGKRTLMIAGVLLIMSPVVLPLMFLIQIVSVVRTR